MNLPHLSAPELAVRAVVGTAVLVVAGWSVARVAVTSGRDEFAAGAGDGDTAMRRLVVALAWGVGVVPTFAFFAHLLGGVTVSAGAVAVSAVGHVLAATAIARLRGASGSELVPWHGLAAALRRCYRPVIAAFAIFAWWFVDHDPAVPPGSCVTQAAAVAAGWNVSDVDLLHGNLGDNRLGNSGVIAGAMAVYGQLAFRMLYGLLAAMLALGGWLLGRAAIARRWAGWLGLAVLALNPYVASLPLIDENLLTLAFAASFLPLVFAPGVSWLAIGALYGLAATMRHPLGLALPAMLLGAWRTGRWRAVGGLLSGGLVMTACEHLHHVLAFGSVLRFESNAYFMPQDYELFGLRWRWKGFLNWPFHDRLIRTPHNPFPMLIMWPLAVLDHLGLVLSALGTAGFVAIWRRPGRALFWLLWFAPVMASIAVQEAWDYPNKMGVILIVFVPVVRWITAGAAAVARGGRRVWIAVAAIALSLLAGAGAVRSLDVPADARYLRHYQIADTEDPAEQAELRRLWTSPALWPSPARYGRYGPGGTLADLGTEHELTVSWGWPRREVPAFGGPVTVALRTGRKPALGIVPADTPVDVDLTTNPGRHIVTPATAGADGGGRENAEKSGRPWWLTAIRGAHVTILELSARPRDPAACEPDRDQRKCLFYGTLDHGVEPRANAAATEVRARAADRVVIRLPAGGVSLARAINEIGGVVELSRFVVDEGAAIERGRHLFWHN